MLIAASISVTQWRSGKRVPASATSWSGGLRGEDTCSIQAWENQYKTEYVYCFIKSLEPSGNLDNRRQCEFKVAVDAQCSTQGSLRALLVDLVDSKSSKVNCLH